MRAKLFVGNLNYETTIDKLEGVFRPFTGYLHTKICYERHSGKPLGYAVVHFDNPAAAQYAIDMLHNVEVDGRHIVVAPYRPRVSDATGPKPSPRPPSRPGADEAVALVMDLHKNATWMDLKDILSQQSKVLFVDEPRMLRAAFVHFASEEDREQARAAFRNTQVLGNTVDLVPIDKDSILLGPEASGTEDLSHPPPGGPMPGQPGMGPAMLPVTYMPQGGMAPMPPFMGLEQGTFPMQRPPMWQATPMQPFISPPFAVPPMQPPGQSSMPGAPGQPPAVAGMAAGHLSSSGASLSGGPQAGSSTGQNISSMEGSGMPPGYAGAVGAGFSGSAGPTGGVSGSGAAGGQRGVQQGAGGTSESGAQDAAVNLPPELQQLVRQLALQRLGAHPQQDPPPPHG